MAEPAVPVHLVDAVIFLMGFLELNDEKVLSDPDNVVKALESAYYELRQLTQNQREGVALRAAQLADEAEQRHGEPATVAFLRDFANAGGLLEDDA